MTPLTRRELLEAAGSGLLLVFGFRPAEAQQEPAQLPQRQAGSADLNVYLKIAPDGKVTGFSGKVELGQGAATVLSQILAEELDVPYDSVSMVLGDTDLCPTDMGTFGSMNVRNFGPLLRGAGAEARAILVQMAAEQLGVPAARLQVKAGVVSDPNTPGKSVTYGQLVQGKRIERHIPNVAPKPVSAYTIVGKPAARKDALDKVTGKAKYSGDVMLPGMLHGRVLRLPAYGAKLKSVDSSAAEKMGARVVKEGDFVAVLHERPDLADKALSLLKAEFDLPQPSVNDQSIYQHLLEAAPPAQAVSGGTGDVVEGERISSSVVEETYLNAYVAHAAMETHSATANIENGKVTVWASTQAPFGVRQPVAQTTGVAQQNVHVITTYVGGGFGGKTAAPQAADAARLAKATGKPVQVVWSRADEFFNDTFRPAAVVKIRSGVTSGGKIAFWDCKVVGAGDREAQPYYDIPNKRATSAGGWSGGNPPGMNPFGVGAWRAPSVNTNTFARESHMDTMAAKLGVDPLEFRLQHLSAERMKRVLEAVAKQFQWKAGKAPSGRGVGVACGMYSDACSASMAEVSVDRSTGRVRVKRIVSAIDVGLAINPDGIRQQMEGCLTMGLGYSLTEEVRFKDGAVLDDNFDTYQIPRFSWLPKIETIVVDEPNSPAIGCGEPPIITVGAVIANAIFDAVGARILQLPMTPARVLEALKKV